MKSNGSVPGAGIDEQSRGEAELKELRPKCHTLKPRLLSTEPPMRAPELQGSDYAAARLKSASCASNARLKAGREVQRSRYATRRGSSFEVSEWKRNTVAIIRSPTVK